MSRQYRLLQYIVDPFARRRVTVAALIRDNGTVRVVLAPAERVMRGLGRLRAGRLLASLRRDIEALDSFERLPRSFGPQFVLAPPESIPAGDTVGWVQARLDAAA
jgi:hypothetical protein